ncbi:MAG: MotA/TolQ/ExbB proton channel family protein [Verrucomicrobiales bacterium]|nr:MotA/TolQ/ExbB proton channel family protein [Verrucomicrobiales bacterium]
MVSSSTERLLLAQGGTFADGLHSVWHFFTSGGWFMAPIIACMFTAAVLVIFKFLDLRREATAPKALQRLLERAETLAAAGRLAEVERFARDSETPLARICRQAILVDHDSKDAAARSTEALAREEISRLERGIPALEVIFTIAPLLGLIGTVSGLVVIFGSFGAKASVADQSRFISAGISEALNCTIAGLLVAVPAYIFQSHFARRIEALALRMNTLATGLLNAAYRTGAEPEFEPAIPAQGR